MTDIVKLLDERKAVHGDYAETARVAQNIKAMFHDSPNWSRLSAMQIEALEMMANKLGRILNGDPDYSDHWVDIQGYAKLVSDRLQPEKPAPRSLQPVVAKALEKLSETA